jgi:hypothetical protein
MEFLVKESFTARKSYELTKTKGNSYQSKHREILLAHKHKKMPADDDVHMTASEFGSDNLYLNDKDAAPIENDDDEHMTLMKD